MGFKVSPQLGPCVSPPAKSRAGGRTRGGCPYVAASLSHFLVAGHCMESRTPRISQTGGGCSMRMRGGGAFKLHILSLPQSVTYFRKVLKRQGHEFIS